MKRKIVLDSCEGCPYLKYKAGLGNGTYTPTCYQNGKDLPYREVVRDGQIIAVVTFEFPDWCPLEPDAAVMQGWWFSEWKGGESTFIEALANPVTGIVTVKSGCVEPDRGEDVLVREFFRARTLTDGGKTGFPDFDLVVDDIGDAVIVGEQMDRLRILADLIAA